MEEIIPFPKYYDWAQSNLEDNICHNFFNEKIPIAELWYGTHINGRACIQSTGEYIDEYLLSKMNYQFKLLSIGKPLSIQVHPSGQVARQLHQLDPTQFPDDIGKHEMAMALKDNTILFCGIKPFEEIQYEIQNHFHEFFDSNLFNTNHVIRNLCINLLEMDQETYQKLRKRLFFNEKYDIFRYLEYHFPNDRGCALCVLFLNELRLKKYETVYIPTGTIHCYIQGNLFEVMTSSDNVIRIGLTSKYKNYSAFFQYSHFNSFLPDQNISPLLPTLRCVKEIGTIVLCFPKHIKFFFIVMLEGHCICNKKFSLKSFKVYIIKNSFDVYYFENSNHYSFLLIQ